MDRQGKIYQDEITVEAYRKDLENERKVYMQKASARAINNRRARALAVGECCLKAMDGVREVSKVHPLMVGSLAYMIDEKVIYPVAGAKQKEFEYEVMYQVTSNEKAWTKEEIEEKVGDLEFRLAMETDEMFPEEGEKDGGDSSLRSE